MAFRNKTDAILVFKPDILIIPECENFERLSFGLYSQQPTDSVWYGDLPIKGIGVFTFNGFKIKLLDVHNSEFKYILPLLIYNDHIAFTVFAVWAQNTKNHYNYTEHVWHALEHYQHLLQGENVILVGDFNSNTIWDRPREKINHTAIVEYLRQKNIISTYHHFHNQIQGKERHHTFHMYRKEEQPFHLDYCFASANLIDKLIDVEVGDYETWGKLSDHMPLMVTFE
jgi:exonuclease III